MLLIISTFTNLTKKTVINGNVSTV